jgi:multidrug efflux pump subunit AcrA (membrane-fusion protein)
MVARVEIVWRTLEDVPLLPIDALVEHEGEMGYFVVSGGVARWREPALGPRNGELVAVESGAGPGDSVVVLGQTRLTDGSRIRVETAP